MKNTFRIASALLAAATLSACSDDTKPSDIQGVQWSLTSLQPAGAASISIEDPTKYTVRFETDGKINVVADCNSCSGTYALSDSTLSITGSLTCTEIACPAGSQSAPFLAIVGAQSSTLDRNDENLELTSTAGSLNFAMR
jgi:heat shock protein HslJ